MATSNGTSSQSGAIAEPSARQQDYSDLSVLSDRKIPHPPENDDALSSTAASPQSMRTIEDNAELNDIVDELLPPPYTPMGNTILQQHNFEHLPAGRQYGAVDIPDQPQGRALAADGDEETSLLVIRPGGQSYNVRRQRKVPRRRCCACCGLLCSSRVIKALIISAVLASLIIWVAHEIRQSRPEDSHHDHDRPTPDDPVIPWPTCPRDLTPKHSRHMAVEYNKLNSFSLLEGFLSLPPIDNHEDRHQIYGKVHVTSTPKQSADITAQVFIESTEEAVGSAVNVFKSGDELKIDLGDLYHVLPRDARQSCTIIKVMLSIAGDVGSISLSTFNFDATHLSIELADKLHLPVTEALSLSTVSGSAASHADVHSIPKRTVVHSASGHISGVWPLNDLLYLDTISGPIDVTYVPVRSSDDLASAHTEPAVANLTLTSISGNIKASLKSSLSLIDWPSRRYFSRIKSQSGNVRGHYPLGESADFVCSSGRLDIDILPIAFRSHVISATSEVNGQRGQYAFEAHLSTLSVSGDVDVRVHSGPKQSESWKFFNATQSSHVGTSGKLKLAYPNDWAGMLEATSISGKQTIDGEGLEIVESRHGWAKNYVKAAKKSRDDNVGGSKAEIETITGSLLFRLMDD